MQPERVPGAGTLYLVGTPIGNLEDITLRAVATLQRVAAVAAEDTRRTKSLLSHLGITKKPLYSANAHLQPASLDRLMALLEAGEDLALVTDAGMPAVSDPGAELVRAASARGLSVVCIPGPSAVTTAAAVSGLVNGPFSFLGFLARKGKKRQQELAFIEQSTVPVVLFESPLRTPKTLRELAQTMPERPAALCRELTKLHEEVLRGSLTDLAHQLESVRGEVTLVIAARQEPQAKPLAGKALDRAILELLSAGHSTKDVSHSLAGHAALSRQELYARVLQLRDQQPDD